jgi:hypothetical protein
VEQSESVRRQGREQPSLVSEMVRRRGVGDASPPGQAAQAEPRRPEVLNLLGGSGKERRPQIAMVVRAFGGRSAHGVNYPPPT